MSEHGSATIKDWMRELVELARTGKEFETSGGAEPGRSYAYLEYHQPDDSHSILLFRVEEHEGRSVVRAYSFQGRSQEVRQRVDELTHAPEP